MCMRPLFVQSMQRWPNCPHTLVLVPGSGGAPPLLVQPLRVPLPFPLLLFPSGPCPLLDEPDPPDEVEPPTLGPPLAPTEAEPPPVTEVESPVAHDRAKTAASDRQ